MRFALRCSELQYEETWIPAEEIEEAADSLTNNIRGKTPRMPKGASQFQGKHLTPREEELLKKKYEARKKWARSRDLRDKKVFNRLKGAVDEMVLRKKEESWDDAVKEVEENHISLWPVLKRFGKVGQLNNPIECDGRWHYGKAEKQR